MCTYCRGALNATTAFVLELQFSTALSSIMCSRIFLLAPIMDACERFLISLSNGSYRRSPHPNI